jgi:hypothetical protein
LKWRGRVPIRNKAVADCTTLEEGTYFHIFGIYITYEKEKIIASD